MAMRLFVIALMFAVLIGPAASAAYKEHGSDHEFEGDCYGGSESHGQDEDVQWNGHERLRTEQEYGQRTCLVRVRSDDVCIGSNEGYNHGSYQYGDEEEQETYNDEWDTAKACV